MFKSFMPQKGFDLLRFHFIQEGKRDVEENKPEKLNNALNGGFYWESLLRLQIFSVQLVINE